jgi:glycosyltransferase involved in cell wall biosynthesis
LIGRFTRAKGHLVALEAFARVARELPQTRFLLSGDPFDISEGFLRERAGDLGLSEAVVFLPRQSDVRVVMSALDVGVVASLRSEAICRVALEYQALGVPVVGTDLNSIPEMVANRTTGLIVSTNDAGSLARAVIRLLEEPELQAKLSAAGPDHIRKNYSYDDWISRTESLYRFLIKRPA